MSLIAAVEYGMEMERNGECVNSKLQLTCVIGAAQSSLNYIVYL